MAPKPYRVVDETTWRRGLAWSVEHHSGSYWRRIASHMSERTARRVARLLNEEAGY